jgi:hypothetical protein
MPHHPYSVTGLLVEVHACTTSGCEQRGRLCAQQLVCLKCNAADSARAKHTSHKYHHTCAVAAQAVMMMLEQTSPGTTSNTDSACSTGKEVV